MAEWPPYCDVSGLQGERLPGREQLTPADLLESFKIPKKVSHFLGKKDEEFKWIAGLPGGVLRND